MKATKTKAKIKKIQKQIFHLIKRKKGIISDF